MLKISDIHFLDIFLQKKITMKQLFLFLAFATLFSCSSDDDKAQELSVKLNTVTYVDSNTVIVMGEVSSKPRETAPGIVYSTTPGAITDYSSTPTLIFYDDTHFSAVINGASPDTTFYLRTFTFNSNSQTYTSSNDEKAYTLKPVVAITNIKYVTLSTCQVDITVDTSVTDFTLNFTGDGSIPGGKKITGNTGSYTVEVTGNFAFGEKKLKPVILTGYPLGPPTGQMSFEGVDYTFQGANTESAVGQTGEGGGKIFYDKGEYTDGWRYMEFAWNISYDPETTTITCDGAVTQTSFGSGPANTESTVANCPDTTAAKLCADFTQNGKDDWFLPSADEAMLIGGYFIGSSNLSGVLITSSGYTGVSYNHHYPSAYITLTSNTPLPYYLIVPVRRY